MFLISLPGSKMIIYFCSIFKWLFCQITTERLMVIFKIDPRCLPFFSDVLRKIMSAGTRWFCVMKRKTVTLNSHVWGFRSPPPPPAPWGGGTKPTASFTFLPLSQTDLGIYFVLNLKNLARCCYFTNPLLKSYLGKRAASFLENPTITSWNSSQKGPGREPATLAGFLPGGLLKLKTHTHSLTLSAPTNFRAWCLALSGILIRKSSCKKQGKPFSRKNKT